MRAELICFLYDKKMQDDLGIKTKDIEAKITIDTREIESVRERVADEETDICKKTCMINMKSGESFLIKQSYRNMIFTWMTSDQKPHTERTEI